MPSPIGHALAGIATAWTVSRPKPIQADRGLLFAAACLAVVPDADLVHPGWHRAYTHSIGAVLLVTIITVVVTGWVKEPVKRSEVLGSRVPGSRAVGSKVPSSRVVIVCGAAYASHLLLDWLGADYFAPYGIRALWPFDDGWYISGVEIFRQTARLHLFTRAIMVQNAEAIAQEIAILLPIVYVLWLVRVKPAARLASQLARADHPAE
jgi:membrane-bound metal-dependent hydrolase YbcI (DUF457 family)